VNKFTNLLKKLFSPAAPHAKCTTFHSPKVIDETASTLSKFTAEAEHREAAALRDGVNGRSMSSNHCISGIRSEEQSLQ
jgi:hypothetical protein